MRETVLGFATVIVAVLVNRAIGGDFSSLLLGLLAGVIAEGWWVG